MSDLRHRILVTGGKGFVGSHLTRSFATGAFGECDVIGLDRDGGEAVDIQDVTALEAVIKDARPTAIIHLAAVAAPSDAARSRRMAWDVNLMGTFNVADATMRHAPKARFVYVGSSEAYGASFVDSSQALDEDASLKPATVYAATKAAADLMIGQMARDGLRAVRFRPFNHTGPGQTTAYVVPSFAAQVADIVVGGGERRIHVGNLDVRRDFTDVRDIVRAYAIAATIDRDHVRGSDRTYNLASGRPRAIREILEHLIALSGCDIEIFVDPDRVRPNEVPFVAGDASRAGAELGWNASIPFESTLADILAEQLERRRAGTPWSAVG